MTEVDEFRIFREGDQWCAVRSDFKNLQESPAGFGDMSLVAFMALTLEMGNDAERIMWQAKLRTAERQKDEAVARVVELANERDRLKGILEAKGVGA